MVPNPVRFSHRIRLEFAVLFLVSLVWWFPSNSLGASTDDPAQAPKVSLDETAGPDTPDAAGPDTPEAAGVEGTQAAAPARPLKVGTKLTPPFVMKDGEGRWTGISIELWASLAKELGITYELQETDLKGLIDGVHDGRFDLSVAASTITESREEKVDFSHSFYSSGLAIAVPVRAEEQIWESLMSLFSLRFLKAVGALLVILLLVGVVVWWFERRRNEEFGGSVAEGIAAGLWWSAVTMTTVGYGDKSPITPIGRTVAMIWMFTSVIVISSFTATIATALTIEHFAIGLEGPDDLARVTTGSVQGSTSAEYLEHRRFDHRTFATPAEALEALAAGEVAAVVHDAPVLQYLINTRFRAQVKLLPGEFEQQSYGIALPTNSPLREPLNRSLLSMLKSDHWRDIRFRYLGNDGS